MGFFGRDEDEVAKQMREFRESGVYDSNQESFYNNIHNQEKDRLAASDQYGQDPEDYNPLPEEEGGYLRRSGNKAMAAARERAADRLEDSPGGALTSNILRGGKKNTGKSSSGIAGRKAALLAASIVVPAFMMGFVLYTLQSGLRIEHIDRITTAMRFGAFHRELNSRIKHMQVTALVNDGDITPAAATYRRTRLGERVLGWTPNKAVSSLGLDGEFEITTRRNALGQQKIDTIIDKRTGDVFDARDIDDLNKWKDVADQRIGVEAGKNGYFTRKTTNHIFKNASIPFSRYRSILNRIRGGERLTSVLIDQLTTKLLWLGLAF